MHLLANCKKQYFDYICDVSFSVKAFLHFTKHGKKLPTLQKSLKGQSHDIFCTWFLHQSDPPGPISRDVRGPIQLFPCFHNRINCRENQQMRPEEVV